ncbi:hypothetical protein B0H10DRAFT_2072964 [Mycena sp. CBHHK59/15]|nr:hypothetical protein B0H10DRAFT_2072964 [Mycena sp. CBHHK59/15]
MAGYSSDHVCKIIQYIPEFDFDTPNKTWSVAESILLNIYGFFDESYQNSVEHIPLSFPFAIN